MNGQFIQELSSGIFSRLGERRQEQTSKDAETKGQIINLLAGLVPQVERESLPVLMGHLGDLMGVKGRMRKFWDVFSL
jgi:hypothetical protein